MGVVGIISSASLVCGDGTTEKKGEDTILVVVAVVFIERQEHERSAVVEVGVVEKRTQPPLGPVPEESRARICVLENQLCFYIHT